MISLRRWLGIACGVLGWPEQAFWTATPHALFASIEMYRIANGADQDDAKREDFAKFRAEFETSGIA